MNFIHANWVRRGTELSIWDDLLEYKIFLNSKINYILHTFYVQKQQQKKAAGSQSSRREFIVHVMFQCVEGMIYSTFKYFFLAYLGGITRIYCIFFSIK